MRMNPLWTPATVRPATRPEGRPQATDDEGPRSDPGPFFFWLEGKRERRCVQRDWVGLAGDLNRRKANPKNTAPLP